MKGVQLLRTRVVLGFVTLAAILSSFFAIAVVLANSYVERQVFREILADEIGHVAIGNRWYRWLCAQRGLDPVVCYAQLAQRHRAPRLRGPFNLDARRAAGFDEQELAALQAP